MTDKEAKSREYKAENIRVLEGLEGVRHRPAMYIGSTSKTGLHHLVWEIVDNAVDEAMGGYCDLIEVSLNKDGSVTVTDNGRGIPVDMHPVYKRPAVEIAVTKLHAGGKFDKKTYMISGGLHGVGVSVVNALSSKLIVEIKRDGKVYYQEYEHGVPKTQLLTKGDTDETGTTVRFYPNMEILETSDFHFETLAARMRELAFLNKGLSISILDERTDKRYDFYYEGGIVSFVEHLNKNKAATQVFEKNFIHLHVPSGATPKDGPSAGITMASALYSLALDKAVKPRWAMTGELSLTGLVMPVGGIKEKTIAAKRSGVLHLVFPSANRKDYEELPAHIRRGIKMHFVDTFDDVVKLCFP